MLKVTLNADNNTYTMTEGTFRIYQKALSLLTELYYDYKNYEVFQDITMEEVEKFLSKNDQI